MSLLLAQGYFGTSYLSDEYNTFYDIYNDEYNLSIKNFA